jgi:multimeric flavodoxin WrbA
MRVLGLIGSPRKKGNTAIMVDTFLDGAKSAGAEVKKYFLKDLTINQCMGCFRNCMVQPGYKCKIYRDDMDTIMPDMAASDLMLFASPLYCATYTAIMARFFERCLPFW